MTPEEFDEFLRSNSEEKFKGFTEKLINTSLDMVGVRVPILRKAAKEISKGDWRDFLTWEMRSYEQCFVKGVVIASAKMCQEERLELSDRFLPEITDWSVCDSFCGSWKVERGKEDALWDWSADLLDTGEEFRMRVGAVMMMDHFIDDAHIGRMLDLLTAERRSPGYYWDMGCAWALSFCFIRYPDETEEAMFRGTLSTEILRMTVNKVRDSYRVPDDRKKALREHLNRFTGRS